jgi:hypothetical protein
MAPTPTPTPTPATDAAAAAATVAAAVRPNPAFAAPRRPRKGGKTPAPPSPSASDAGAGGGSQAVWQPPSKAAGGSAASLGAILGPTLLGTVDGIAALNALEAATSRADYAARAKAVLDLAAESIEQDEMRTYAAYEAIRDFALPPGADDAAAVEAAFRESLAETTRGVLDRGNSTARGQKAAINTLEAA